MDLELRFIAALLFGNSVDQERFYCQQIPKGVFKLREQEIHWVYSFREKHGRYPSATAFQHKFEEKIFRHKDPFEASLQPILDRSMFDQMCQVQERTKKILDEGNIARAMEVMKEGVSRLSGFSTDYVDIDFARNRGSIRRYIDLVRLKTIEAKGGISQLVNTPWSGMNNLIHFFRPGESIVLAARTALGKSWSLVYLANHLVNKQITTLFITKEMTSDSISDRFEALKYKLPWTDFRRGSLSPSDLRRWKKARKADVEPYPLFISGEETIEGVGMEHIVSKIDQYDPKVVIIDGAYLINPEGISNRANTVERYAHISKRVKTIAKARKKIIIIVIQMNRNAEHADGTTKGSITSLYGSDSWGQDADYVFDLCGQRGTRKRVLSLLKGRDTAIGEITTRFQLDPYPDFRQIGEKESGEVIEAQKTFK